MKTYELLKDLGDLKAGTRAQLDPVTGYYHFRRTNGLYYQYSQEAVESNQEWFREVREKEAGSRK
jgi:hypothetical protein